MQKIALIIIGVVLIAVGVWYVTSSGMLTNNDSTNETDTANAVAMVNGEAISRDALEARKSQMLAQQGMDSSVLNAELESQLDTQVIQELINQALIQQAVTASSITISQEDVDAQVDATISQLGDAAAFEEALAAQGLSEEEFRRQIRENLATQTYLEQELELSAVTATEEEIENAYAQATEENEEVPPLEDVRSQVEQSVIQQKQQSLIAQLIETLRASAEVEVLL